MANPARRRRTSADGVVLLTRPVRPSLRWRVSKVAFRAGRIAKRHGPPLGPQAVLASLTRGLQQLDTPHVVNPPREPGPGAAAGVLTDPAALHEAIGWR